MSFMPRLISFLFIISSHVLNLLPLSWWWGIGSILGWFWFDVFRIRRFGILKNISIAFPEKSKQERMQIARQSTRFLGISFLEVLLLPAQGQSWAEKKVRFVGLENYQIAKKNTEKGILLLSIHLGNGDVGMNAMVQRGFKLHVISKKFKNKVANEIWFGLRERNGLGFIDPHGSKTAFAILGALKKREDVIFVMDQFMGKPYGIETTFFGRKTGTAYGLALFALKTGAPVIPVFSYRDQNRVTHVEFGSAIPASLNQNRDLQILEMTQKYNSCLEDMIRQRPEQWMWVHRRWKKWE